MKKTILIVLLSAFLSSAMIVPALAQDMTVGVSVGDWFKYENRITEWTHEEAFLPEGYFGPLTLADNETNFILYTVTDILPVDGGANVTFTITYDWKNGSVTEGELVETVSTANQNLFAIGANMEPDDMVSDEFSFFGMMDYPARTINSTIDREYLNEVIREANTLEYTIEIFGSPYDYVYQWDKETGMRVYYESHGDVAEFGDSPAYTYTVVSELVDSSIEGLVIPEFTGLIMLSLLVAITIPLVLYKRKTLKR